jgi:hypothetical protein
VGGGAGGLGGFDGPLWLYLKCDTCWRRSVPALTRPLMLLAASPLSRALSPPLCPRSVALLFALKRT